MGPESYRINPLLLIRLVSSLCLLSKKKISSLISQNIDDSEIKNPELDSELSPCLD